MNVKRLVAQGSVACVLAVSAIGAAPAVNADPGWDDWNHDEWVAGVDRLLGLPSPPDLVPGVPRLRVLVVRDLHPDLRHLACDFGALIHAEHDNRADVTSVRTSTRA
jgi:hypothetical protein